MSSDTGPVQLDENVVYEEKLPGRGTKKKLPGILVAAAAGVILIIALLIYQPDNTGFIDSPPPAEQAERDSVAAIASAIVSLSEQDGLLPRSQDLDLPEGYMYLVETDSTWSLETPGGLYYTSDMDISEFQEGLL